MDTQKGTHREPRDGINRTTLHERVRQIIKLAIRIHITKSWKVFINILNFTWKPDDRCCEQPLICLRGNNISGHYSGESMEEDVGQGLTGNFVWHTNRCGPITAAHSSTCWSLRASLDSSGKGSTKYPRLPRAMDKGIVHCFCLPSAPF